MLKSSLCDYGDAHIHESKTLTVTSKGAHDEAKKIDEREKEVMFKNVAPLTYCISKINNTQIYNAKDLAVVMSMYNLIVYSIDYSKSSIGLWQYNRDKANITLADFKLFKLK